MSANVSSAFRNGMEEINNKKQITLILKLYHIFFCSLLQSYMYCYGK